MACSIGISTDSVSTLALAPGYDALTITIGGDILGNCDMGRLLIAKNPIKIITNDMVIANTGL
jgi:hypothetical protein